MLVRVCQKPQKDAQRCNFFLWDTEATPRENAALLSNSRTEPAHQKATTTPSRPPPKRSAPASRSAVTNQKRTRADLPGDDDFGGADVDFEAQLDRARVEAETPSKKRRTTEAFATPRRKLPWTRDSTTSTGGLQTPQTERRRTHENPFVVEKSNGSSLFTPSKPGPSHVETAPSFSPTNTPTSRRFQDVNGESALVKDVFALLGEAGVALGEQTRGDLGAVLAKHETIAEGVRRGRDVARSTIKARDARVQELTHRISTLEAELEAERKMVEYLQYKAQNEYDSD